MNTLHVIKQSTLEKEIGLLDMV